MHHILLTRTLAQKSVSVGSTPDEAVVLKVNYKSAYKSKLHTCYTELKNGINLVQFIYILFSTNRN